MYNIEVGLAAGAPMTTTPSRLETIVLLVLIFTGIIMGTLFYYDEKPDISAVMYALSLASILYRFLGGIGNQNSLALGAIKLSGSAAVLFGFIYGLDAYIFSDTPAYLPASETVVQISPSRGWIPINLGDGSVEQVTITQNDSLIFRFPESKSFEDQRSKHEYTLRGENQKLAVVNSASGDTIGYTRSASWEAGGLFGSIKLSEREDAYRFTLYPEADKKSSRKTGEVKHLPFEIIQESCCRYKIMRGKEELVSKIIVPRTGTVVSSADSKTCYIVFIEQANSLQDDIPDYSKWIIIPLVKY